MHSRLICLFSVLLATIVFSSSAHASVSTPVLESGALYLIKVTGVQNPPVLTGQGAGSWPWTNGAGAEYTIVTGNGVPLVVNLANTPSIDPVVKTYKLSLRHPYVGKALETIKVPVIGTVVTTKLVTQRAKLYIISASGEGRVGFGAGGVGRPGDADYMDYSPDGTGNTDIGDRGVDYGVGVDETDPNVSPRQHKWGPWRKDHTYYLIFVGDGNPIKFLYYDSNYLDNSPTDSLTVKIYSAP